MKENQVFKELRYAEKNNKAKGAAGSVFTVWQVTEKHKAVTVNKSTLFGLNIYRKDGKKKNASTGLLLGVSFADTQA